MITEPNTPKFHPKGKGWHHFVRVSSASKRAGIAGTWYASDNRNRADDPRLVQFVRWFERQVEAELAAGVTPELWWLGGRAPYSPLALWIRETSEAPLAAYETDGVWRAVRDLVGRVATEPQDRDATDVKRNGIDPLYGADLGEYVPALKSGAKPNLFVSHVWRREDDGVSLLVVREKAKGTKELVDSAVEQTLRDRPELPVLKDELLPPRPTDGRSARTIRRHSAEGIADYMENAVSTISTLHDGVVAAVQAYLDDLTEDKTACPRLEDNQTLAKGILSLADTFGVKLFCRSRAGDIKQVRVRAVPAKKSGDAKTPAVEAGNFLAYTVGTTPSPVHQSATFPRLIAARNLAQAQAIYAGRGADEPE